MKKCILVKTQDNLEFITSKENLPSLKEFIETFNAKTLNVLVDEKEEMLNLKSITSLLNKEKEPIKINYTLYEESNETQEVIIEKKIFNFVLYNQKISLDYIKNKYDFDAKTILKYKNKIKSILKKDGILLVKNKDGYYEKKTAQTSCLSSDS